MSALARYFNAMGKSVSGYDKTPTKLTSELIAEGINIHFEDNVNLIPSTIVNQQSSIDNSLIVYTPAVPKGHSEYVFFNSNGFNIKKRAEVLGMITETSYTVAVAGTHGKTTTSSLVAHILKTAGLDPSAFLGGITQNYNTNLAKGLGNLFSRVLKLAKTHNVQTEYNCAYDSLYLDNFDIRGGINNIWSKINELNVYIEKTSPFRLIKFDETKEQAVKDIQYLLQELYWIAVHLEPYLPSTSQTIKKHLHSYELVQLFPTVSEIV